MGMAIKVNADGSGEIRVCGESPKPFDKIVGNGSKYIYKGMDSALVSVHPLDYKGWKINCGELSFTPPSA